MSRLTSVAWVTHVDVPAAIDFDVAGLREGGMKPSTLSVDRQDAVRGPVQDQGRDVDAGQVGGVILQPAGWARPRRVRGRFGAGIPRARTVSSLTRCPRYWSRLTKSPRKPVSQAKRSARMACWMPAIPAGSTPGRIVRGAREGRSEGLDDHCGAGPPVPLWPM